MGIQERERAGVRAFDMSHVKLVPSCRFVYRESNVIKSIKIDRQKEVLSWQKEG
jgi:hypothetical protein